MNIIKENHEQEVLNKILDLTEPNLRNLKLKQRNKKLQRNVRKYKQNKNAETLENFLFGMAKTIEEAK